MAVPGVTLGIEVLFCLIVLAANDVTKLFFWSPHAQIYNLFVPCVMVTGRSVLGRTVRQGMPRNVLSS